MSAAAFALLMYYAAGWILLLMIWMEISDGARWVGLVMATLWPLLVPLLSLYAIAVYAHEFWLHVRPPSGGREP